jgi:DNA-binding transcriptional MerR regulator
MRIKELSEKTGLSCHTLRYYEKIGLIQSVKRDANGQRIYDENTIGWVQFLIKMKLTRMPLSDLIVYANSFYANDPDVDKRIALLKAHKSRVLNEIAALREACTYIDYKIDYYQQFKANKKSG